MFATTPPPAPIVSFHNFNELYPGEPLATAKRNLHARHTTHYGPHTLQLTYHMAKPLLDTAPPSLFLTFVKSKHGKGWVLYFAVEVYNA